jgi:hypothetical protein
MTETAETFRAKCKGVAAALNCASRISVEHKDGVFHVEAAIINGPSQYACHVAADRILHLCEGKAVYIHVPPESETYVDFVLERDNPKGYVRFSFCDRPGHWQERQATEDGDDKTVAKILAGMTGHA